LQDQETHYQQLENDVQQQLPKIERAQKQLNKMTTDHVFFIINIFINLFNEAYST
jgi:hypothetical protein